MARDQKEPHQVNRACPRKDDRGRVNERLAQIREPCVHGCSEDWSRETGGRRVLQVPRLLPPVGVHGRAGWNAERPYLHERFHERCCHDCSAEDQGRGDRRGRCCRGPEEWHGSKRPEPQPKGAYAHHGAGFQFPHDRDGAVAVAIRVAWVVRPGWCREALVDSRDPNEADHDERGHVLCREYREKAEEDHDP